MHKLPYENLVKSMMFRKEQPHDIVVHLRELDLSIPTNIIDLCKDLYSYLEKQYPDYFRYGRKNTPESDHLLSEGIYGLYHAHYDLPYDPELRYQLTGYDGAIRILEDPKMRRAVQSMALARVTDEDIELMLNARYDLNYGPDDIIFYLQHFFNVKNWRTPHLKDLVDAEVDESFKSMYMLALKGDKGYLLWKLGLSPNRSYQEMLQDMMNDAFYLFKENSKSGKADHDLAYKWSQVALKTAEKLERSEKEETDSQQLFHSIEFNITAPNTPKAVISAEELGEDLPEFKMKSKTPENVIPKVDPQKVEEGKTKIKGFNRSTRESKR